MMVGEDAVSISRTGRPVAQVLAMLVLCILAPAVLLTGVLIWRAGNQERAQADEQATQLARSVSTNLDREIDGSLETLVALSTSLSLQRGDFESFYRQASATMAFRRVHVFLKSVDGRQLINTRVAWGTSCWFA